MDIKTELTKIAKTLKAGWGAMSGDLSDQLEAVVFQNRKRNPSDIMRMIKNDSRLSARIKAERVKDSDLAEFIKDNLM